MERLTLTVEEAAELLGVGRTSAYEGVRSGEIPAIRVGRRWLVPRAAFMKFLEGQHGENGGEGDKVGP